MEGQTEGDVELSEHDEDEWDRFSSQLGFAHGFWLGFLFAPSSYESRIIRERVRALVEARGKTMHVYLPKSPEELRATLPWLLDPQRAEAGFVWVEGFFLEVSRPDEKPWTHAWDDVFLRANERREALRRHLNGGVVFAAPIEVKERVRGCGAGFRSAGGFGGGEGEGVYSRLSAGFFKPSVAKFSFGFVLISARAFMPGRNGNFFGLSGSTRSLYDSGLSRIRTS